MPSFINRNLRICEGSMEIKKFGVGDILEMKKQHPCGEKRLKVLRVGSDIRVVCMGCGHDMTIPREKLEKNIRGIIPADQINEQK